MKNERKGKLCVIKSRGLSNWSLIFTSPLALVGTSSKFGEFLLLM